MNCCKKENDYIRVCAKVNLDAIRENYLSIKKVSGGKHVIAVIKADAYGHGAVPVAKALCDIADGFAVATLEEATELRLAGITAPLMLLSYLSPQYFETAIDYDITQTVYSLDIAKKLSETAQKMRKNVKVHFAVNTGMNRIGFAVSEESADIIKQISLLPYIEANGAFTHFAAADAKDKTNALKQLKSFETMCEKLKERNLSLPFIHISNSAAIIDFPGLEYNTVRAGIILYGLYPSDEVDRTKLPLTPAMEVYGRVINVSCVKKGEGISYGNTYITSDKTAVATVHIGYADGYPRLLSNRGRVLIHGKSAPITGRVCMDQMMVDVSGIDNVCIDDVVTIIGRDGEEYISADEVARYAETINYEVVCGFSKRVPRVYV